MKWIPLSERKPIEPFANNIIYGNEFDFRPSRAFKTIPVDATHWLELPSLPEPEKPKDEPAIGHFNFTSNRPFSGDVVDNVNEPVKMKEKPMNDAQKYLWENLHLKKDPDQFYRGKRLPQELIDIAGVCDELKGNPKDPDLNEFSLRYPCHAEKPKDPDWKDFDTVFNEWSNIPHDYFSFYNVLFAMHKFLKAKYDNNN